MISVKAMVGLNQRRALSVLTAALGASLACGEATSPHRPENAPTAGSVAGSDSEGGRDHDGASGSGTSNGGASGEGAAGAPAGVFGGDGGSSGASGAPSSGAGGAEDAGDAGASGAPDAGFVPAPHAAFPLVTNHGGPVLANIEIVPIYFGDDPLFDDLERFNSWVVTSDFWKNAGAEYGVHSGTRKAAQRFDPAPAALTDADVAGWIDMRVADGSLPKPSASTVFVLFYQAGTTITNMTGTNCHAFAGMHESASLANSVFTGEVPFVIIPRCTYSPDDDPFMIATDVATHEYMETATNPLNTTNPAWIMDNASGPLEAWGILSGPAVADLCLSQSYDTVDGFTVQDIWSNAAAKAGLNPCQPSDPAHPYFSVSSEATVYHAQPNSTLTIRARAWSNQPAPDWALSINWGLLPYSDFDGEAELSKTTVNNGDEVTATVTIPKNLQVTDGRSQYRFTIDSIDPINPNFSHAWPILIIVP